MIKLEALESASGMCDVIKIRLNRGGMEREAGKGTPQKELDNPFPVLLKLLLCIC